MSEFLERVWYLATHSRLALPDYVDSSIPNAGAYTGLGLNQGGSKPGGSGNFELW